MSLTKRSFGDEPVTLTLLNNEPVEYVLSPYRWVILGLFCSAACMLNLLLFVFAPISDVVKNYYNELEGDLYIPGLTAITVLVAVPAFPVGSLVMSRVNLTYMVWFLCSMSVIGSLVRYLGGDNYWWTFGGQMIISLGVVVTWCGPSKLSATWFSDNERTLSTSLASMSNFIGIALSFATSSSLVVEPDYQLDTLLLVHVIVSATVSVFCLFFFRAKPDSPPSKSTSVNNVELSRGRQLTYWQSVYSLLTNRSYLFVMFVFGVVYGFIMGLLTVLNDIIESPDEINVGYFGAILIMSGVIGAFIASAVIDRTHAYKIVVVVGLFFAMLSLMWFNLEIVATEFDLISVCFALAGVGLFSLAVIPTSLELAIEFTFPITEVITSGIFMAWASCNAALFIYAMTELQQHSEPGNANWFSFGMLGGATAVATILMGTDYKRLQYESNL